MHVQNTSLRLFKICNKTHYPTGGIIRKCPRRPDVHVHKVVDMDNNNTQVCLAFGTIVESLNIMLML